MFITANFLAAGLIDADYTGPLSVIIFNHSDIAFAMKKSMRVAQLVITPIRTLNPCKVLELTPMETRGSNGWYILFKSENCRHI